MPGLRRQIYATFAGSLSIVSCSMAYAWVSPVLDKLTDPNGEIRASKEQISWIASIIEVGSLITPFLASYSMDRLGRKGTMLCHVPLLVTSWVLTITTRSVPILYFKRVLDGMATGIVNTIAPIYLAEISNPTIRGAILVSVPVSYYIGVLLQFCIGTYLPYALTAEISLLFPFAHFILFSFLPESPYYLMMSKQEDKAANSLAWLRSVHLNQVSEELDSIAQYLQKDAENSESWTAIFKNPIYRKCLFTMMTVVTATIMTGLPVIFSYVTEIFSDISGGLNPDVCSIACALILFLSTIIAFALIDKVGRRPLIILSASGCCISNLASFLFFYYKDKIVYTWIPFATIGSYCLFVSIGLTPVLLAYQGELFPTSVKGSASGMTAVLMTCLTFVTVKLFYVTETMMHFSINYLIYTVVGGIAALLLCFTAPETKNKTFSELYNEYENRANRNRTEYSRVNV